MAIQETQGILLRRQEIRETSLLVVAFTRDLGKIQGLVKGVRGARAAVPWYLEPLTLQSLVLYERRRSPWCLISAFDLLDPFDSIRRNLVRTAYAAFCLDLVDAMTEVSDPHPEIFQLLLGALKGLERGADPRLIARFVEAHLLKIGGLLPPLRSLSLSSASGAFLEQILKSSSEQVRQLPLNPAAEGDLRRLFHRLVRTALDRELKSRLFLQTLGLENPAAAPAPNHQPVARLTPMPS